VSGGEEEMGEGIDLHINRRKGVLNEDDDGGGYFFCWVIFVFCVCLN